MARRIRPEAVTSDKFCLRGLLDGLDVLLHQDIFGDTEEAMVLKQPSVWRRPTKHGWRRGGARV